MVAAGSNSEKKKRGSRVRLGRCTVGECGDDAIVGVSSACKNCRNAARDRREADGEGSDDGLGGEVAREKALLLKDIRKLVAQMEECGIGEAGSIRNAYFWFC